MAKFLSYDGLLYFWGKLKTTFAKKGEAVSNITRSDLTFTATKADGTTFTFDQQDTTYDAATSDAAGLMSAADKTKLDGIATGATANKGTVTSVATGAGLTGGTINSSGTIKAKMKSETNSTLESADVTATEGREYPVTPDASGYLAVNVPWTDTVPTYTAFTGKPTANQTPAFGGTFTIQQIKQDASGQVSATDRTVTIPNTAATASALGLVKVTTGNGLNNSSGTISMSLASSSAAGAMSSTDKAKVDLLKFDSSNMIDSSILPSYVDDVIEAYPVSGATALSQGWLAKSASGSAFTPEAGKIYILMAASGDYVVNTQFRWSGTEYVEIMSGEGVTAITNTEIDTILAS